MSDTRRLALGKRPARHDPRDLRLSRYLTALPPIPTGYIGHGQVIGENDWGMLGNDNYGDCVFAGAAHETMLWNREAGGEATFTDEAVLGDYSAVTGFNPRDPNSDQGTDMRVAMGYRRSTGVADADGNRHRVAAYVAINSLDELKRSIYLFGAAAVGIEFPDSAMDQFNNGEPWDVVKGARIEGGHYVPVVGYDSDSDLFYCVTWSKLQPVTPRFLSKYMDEAYAPLSEEFLTGGKSPEGFDVNALKDDLAHIGDPVDPTPAPTPTPVPVPPAPTPDPAPTPAPGPTDLFQAVGHWWQAVRHWAVEERHVTDNHKAAMAARTLAVAAGLEPSNVLGDDANDD